VRRTWLLWIVKIPADQLVRCYTAFLLQTLWNWYAVGPLHFASINFWEMYGLLLMVGVLAESVSTREEKFLEQEFMFTAVSASVDLCIPDDKQSAIRRLIGEEQVGWPRLAWITAGSTALSRIVEGTCALVVGFFVHIFLA